MLPNLMDPWAEDEELERQLLAEIDARSAAQRTDDDGFDATIAELTAEPAPRAPTPQAPPVPVRAPVAGANGSQVVAPPRPAAPAQSARPDPREADYRRQIQANQDRQRREQRRRGIAGIFMAPLLGAEGVDRFVNQHAGAYQERDEQLRGDLGTLLEQREAAKQERNREILAGLERQRQQANADRDFALRERGVASLEERRRGLDSQADRRLDLQQHTQEWREGQAEIDRAARETRARIMAGQAVGPGGGAAGAAPGRPGGDHAVGAPTVHPDALVVQSIIDTRGDQIMPAAEAEVARLRAAGVDASVEDVAWGIAEQFWNAMPDKEQRRIRAQYAAPPSSTHDATDAERDERARAEHRVPGWNRAPDAPTLGVAERTAAREAPASLAKIERFSRRMEELAREVGALEQTAANARILSQRMAEAQALHEQITNELRVIGNYGVPQAAELARMERLAPSLTSREAFIGSAANQYRAMRSVMQAATEERMRYLGYSRGAAGSGAQAASSTPEEVVGERVIDGVRYQFVRGANGQLRRRRAQ